MSIDGPLWRAFGHLAAQRSQALDARRSDAIEYIEQHLETPGAPWVADYHAALAANSPRELTPAWLKRATRPASPPDTFAEVMAGLLELGHRADLHSRWITGHTLRSIDLARQAAQAEAIGTTTDYLVAGVGRALPIIGPDVREALARALGRWLGVARTTTGADFVRRTLSIFFIEVVVPTDLDGAAWRTLWKELDALVTRRVGQWPNALGVPLRLLSGGTRHYQVLRRLCGRFEDQPELRAEIVESTLLRGATGYARRRLLEPLAGGVLPNHADPMFEVREALDQLCGDLERYEIDPIDDAVAQRIHAFESQRRAMIWTGRHAGPIGDLAGLLGEGLPQHEATGLRLLLPGLAEAAIQAASGPDRVGVFQATSTLLLDGSHALVTRAREISMALQARLEPEEPLAALLLRTLPVLAERARQHPAGEVLHRARARSPVQQRRVWLLTATTFATEQIRASAAGALAPGLDRLAQEASTSTDMSAWAGLADHLHTEELFAPELCQGIADAAPDVLCGVELGLGASQVAVDAADHREVTREEHDAVVVSYGRLFGEIAWALLDQGPQPMNQVWDEWSTAVPHAVDQRWSKDALPALEHGCHARLSARSAKRVSTLLRTMLHDHLGFEPLAARDAGPSVMPAPYRTRSSGWMLCFGPARSTVPVVGAFAEALAASCDPELAALRSRGDAPRGDGVLPQAWVLTHRPLIDFGSQQRQIAAALNGGQVRPLALAVTQALTPFHRSSNAAAKCVRDQEILWSFVAHRLENIPFSLAILDVIRFMTMAVAPFVAYTPEEWRLVFSSAQHTLARQLDPSCRPAWVLFCDRLSTLSEGLPALAALRPILHGDDPVFAEDPEEERSWRELLAGLVACALVGGDGRYGADVLAPRLCLADPLLAQETPASWEEKSLQLEPFCRELLPERYHASFVAVLDGIGVTLQKAHEARPPQPVSTAAQVFDALPGSRARWMVDHLVRHQARRGMRDPEDLRVVRNTGWALPASEALLTEVDGLASWRAPDRIQPERGGLMGYFRAATTLTAEQQQACEHYGRTAFLEDRLNLERPQRLHALAQLAASLDGAPLDRVVGAVLTSLPGPMAERSVEVAWVELARALASAEDLSTTWVELGRVDAGLRATCIRDLDLLIERVSWYAQGWTWVSPADWFTAHVKPFLREGTADPSRRLFRDAGTLLEPTLGPAAGTLAQLLRPLAEGTP